MKSGIYGGVDLHLFFLLNLGPVGAQPGVIREPSRRIGRGRVRDKLQKGKEEETSYFVQGDNRCEGIVIS